MFSRPRKLSLIAGGVVAAGLLGLSGAAVAQTLADGWPYAQSTPPAAADQGAGRTFTLAAVGDIACEPDDAQNAGTPSALKCGSPTLGGYDAEFATAKQADAMHPDAVALLGDEQYQVGKLSDFEGSFEQAWGGLKFLAHPAPGNHEYYAYTKKGDHEAGQNGDGYFAYFNGHDQDGVPNAAGQAGADTDTNQGWYSYDLGNWHIVSLNAECNSPAFGDDCSTTGDGLFAQETRWLAQDLRDNARPCTIAYWHQPTFSSTSTGTATVAASAPGVDSAEGAAADAWWKLLYDNHATLILNGHEHAYARLQPMDPAGRVDPKHGIPEFIVGTGGEAVDTTAVNSDDSYANPNVVTAFDQGYGVMDLTLKPSGYAFSYRPAMTAPGAPASAMSYEDSGAGTCRG
ncbi:MAG TPA: metallophosphoesterase [Microbacterium sp.]|uniref:metallophosphoesterase family protein n=1 Tax=Microbacterium sp. TaxID=51671 RepID=UPI002B464762|nr:metallophosphoesterase [Microbacterium sp.]HKT56122.1 metallophosphoesterase [Microbacterium sp.]